MTYKKQLALMLELWPTLFVDEADVLEHLFGVLGSGYDWNDKGEMDGGTEEEQRADRARSDVSILAQLDRMGPSPTLKAHADQVRAEKADAKLARANEIQRRIDYALKHAKGEYDASSYVYSNGNVVRKLYPQSEDYGPLTEIPDNIKTDWLVAARKFIVMVKGGRFIATVRDLALLEEADKRLSKIARKRLKTKNRK